NKRRDLPKVSRLRIQHRRATALRFYLERLLRLVRRSSQDRNLQRGSIEEKVCAGGNGLRAVGNRAAAPSVHAAHHRGALVAARSRKRIDSVRAASQKARVERCRS